MKKSIKNFLTAIMMLACATVQAQISADEMLKRRCADKVKQMCDYIEYMANPQQKVNNRRYYRTAALNLFVGQGNSYEEDGRIRDGVTMEVTNRSSCKKPYSYLMKQYFSNLINRLDYLK